MTDKSVIYEKTVVEYITDTLEDIPKQSLQTNKRRLHAFFSEQETIEKRGTHFVFRYAFYSVEKLRRPTKQSLFKEYNMLCSDLKALLLGKYRIWNIKMLYYMVILPLL